MRGLPLITALFVWLGGVVQAHEFWIEPKDYHPQEGRLEAWLVNGQNFEGMKIPYIPKWFSRFEIALGDRVEPVQGRMGDVPGLRGEVLGDGLHVVIYQSSSDIVNYAEWEKFRAFVAHKDFPDALARHAERGLPEIGFKEVYTRYSKSLIGVGSAKGADRRFGLETELVALSNPYLDDIKGNFRVQLFYLDQPRGDTQVEFFAKSADGEVTATMHRTDAEGVAVLPVKPGFSYMADAVVLREPGAELAAEKGVVWETLWANLTFAVPQ